jgi:hypothetical protein
MSSRTKTHAQAGRLTKQGFQKPVLRLIETYQLNSKLFHTELLYIRAGVPAFRFLAVFTATPLSVSFCTTTYLTPFKQICVVEALRVARAGPVRQ